ncbi:helix-turn-helix domain-containing protein [Streptomyces sp. NPDC012769]|uniref:helix-turn-helix domain-containing protein n=1 Tax=Streptomyces sp. NPDC012769 TaxID=3364848 RepID=UPI00369E0100
MSDSPVITPPTDRRIGLLATALGGRLTELSERAVDRILAPAGTVAYRRLVPVEELRGSCRAHLTFTLGSLTGRHGAAPATSTALRRAGQGVPLTAVIAAYHAGGRLLLEELTAEARNAGHGGLEALSDGAARLLGLIETGANEITTAYQHARRAAGDPEGSPALAALLDGTASTTEARWRAADTLRLPYDGLFVVLVAEPPPGPAPEIGNRLAAHGIASAWSRTAGLLTGLVSVRDQGTLERLLSVLRRSATLRYGVSPAFSALSECATGLRLARLALATADPDGPPVTGFDDGPLAGLVVHSPDVAARMARSVLGSLLDLPADRRGALIGTLTAWYAASGSVEDAARSLHCHPNTVRQRLRRIRQITGRDVTDPVGTAELYAALQAVRALPPSVLG